MFNGNLTLGTECKACPRESVFMWTIHRFDVYQVPDFLNNIYRTTCGGIT